MMFCLSRSVETLRVKPVFTEWPHRVSAVVQDQLPKGGRGGGEKTVVGRRLGLGV